MIYQETKSKMTASRYSRRMRVITVGIVIEMGISGILLLCAGLFWNKILWFAVLLNILLYGCVTAFLFFWVIPVLGLIDPHEKRMRNVPVVHYIQALIEQKQKEFAYSQTEELVRKQVEFNELQNQINPHFLYNTLESIRAEALSEKAFQIANMVRSLSAFYRYSIGRYHTLVTFREELDNIENYFEIQKYRFGDRFSFSVHIQPEDGACLEYYIIKLCIQPIIENAIYHGIETKAEKGYVRITVNITQSRFIIIISDNGVGVLPERLAKINELLNQNPDDLSISFLETAKGTGMGLLNINKRIKMYFGNEYGLLMRSVVNIGTDVEIVLPIVTQIGE